MKKIILILMLLILIAPVISNAVEQGKDNEVVLFMFYGQGCPHCGKMELFLKGLEEKYPTLKVERYEVYNNQENRELFQKIAEAFNTEIKGVPTVFIDGKVIVGFSNALGESVENEVKRCVEVGCKSPIDKLKADETIHIEEIALLLKNLMKQELLKN